MVGQHGIEDDTRQAESELLEYPLVKANILTDDTTPVEYFLKFATNHNAFGYSHLTAGKRNAQDVPAIPHVADSNTPQLVKLPGAFNVHNDLRACGS
jgi:hypothetical protein